MKNVTFYILFLSLFAFASCDNGDKEVSIKSDEIEEYLQSGEINTGSVSYAIDDNEEHSFDSNNETNLVGMYAADTSAFDYLIYGYEFDFDLSGQSIYEFNYIYLYLNQFPESSGEYKLSDLEGYFYMFTTDGYVILGGYTDQNNEYQSYLGEGDILKLNFIFGSQKIRIEFEARGLSGSGAFSSIDTLDGYIECNLPD